MLDLSIIIVSYNSRNDLEQCLRSIKLSRTRCSYEIVAVDNYSTDGTGEYVASSFPEVKLVQNKENAGFARANNQALQIVGGRYIMLLNPDTVVHEGAFDVMVEYLDGHHDVWALGPAIVNADGSPQRTGVRFPSNGNLLMETFFLDRLFPRSRLFGAHREFYEDFSKPRTVDYVQGSCLVIRKEVIAKVGMLDERFFMYFEETDWCYRIRQAGGAVLFLPSAEIVHLGGSVVGHYDEQRLIQYHRSLLRFYHKHYSPGNILWLKLILAIRSIIRIVAWSAVIAIKPGLRKDAHSSIMGYAKTFTLLLEGA